MAIKESRESSWLSTSVVSTTPDVHLHVHGMPFRFNRELLVARSAKLAILLKDNQHQALPDIPADLKTFELAARFCYGYEPNLSAENVVPLACLSYYLEMTENHSPNNLLQKTLTYFQQKVLPSWNESFKALRATEQVFQQALRHGFVDACVDSIVGKACADPLLLGKPFNSPITHHNREEDNHNDMDYYYYYYHRPSAKRRLFNNNPDWHRETEDLTMLALPLYELIMLNMLQRRVPSEYVAASLFRYANKWAHVEGGLSSSAYYKQPNIYQREVIEAVERLLPNDERVLPCKLLFQMLAWANKLHASSECRTGLEIKIGKQLNQATVEDLLIPARGYARKAQYDIECVRRLLKNFYANYTCSDGSGFIKVAELIDEFLAEVAYDVDLKKETFISLAEMSVATSIEIPRCSDGLYRAIDIYLNKHSYLTESEREEVCGMLNCHKMSIAACEHAAQNGHLPLRVVVQVLFVGQLQMREAMTTSEMQSSFEEDGSRKEVEEEKMVVVSSEEEVVRMEMEKMDTRVMELERECCRMRREIEKGGGGRNGVRKEKGGSSMWRDLKRKFGCMSSSMHDCNYHVKKKKVHPRNGV